MLNPWFANQIQSTKPWHPICGAPYRLGNLTVREWCQLMLPPLCATEFLSPVGSGQTRAIAIEIDWRCVTTRWLDQPGPGHCHGTRSGPSFTRFINSPQTGPPPGLLHVSYRTHKPYSAHGGTWHCHPAHGTKSPGTNTLNYWMMALALKSAVGRDNKDDLSVLNN